MAGQAKKQWVASLSVQRKGLLVVAIPLLMQFAVLGVLTIIVRNELMEVQHHYHMRFMQENMEVMVVRAMSVGLSLVRYRFSKDSQALSDYEDNINHITEAMEKLEAEAVKGGNPREIELADHVKNDASRLVTVGREARQLVEENNSIEAMGSGPRLKRDLSRSVHDLETDVRAFEEELLVTGTEDPAEYGKKTWQVVELAALGVVLQICTAVSMMLLVNNGIVSRLKILTDNTFRLARAEQLLPPIDGHDEIGHLDKVFHDMANALAEAARKERAVIQNAADVICSIESDGTFTRISPASLQVFGYAPEELMGRKYTDILASADVESADKEFHRIIDEETEPQPFETKVVRKDGREVDILWSAYWAPSEQSMFCVAHDITERKRAEEELRASEARVRSIFESAPVALVVVDHNGKINLANPRAEKMFGYATHELMDKPVQTLLAGNNVLGQNDFQEGKFDEMVGHVKQLDAITCDGTIFPIEFTLEHYQTAEGERFLAVMLDVTERQEVERLKREFVSTVSHELRTPLTAIRGSLTLLSVGALGKLGDQAEKMVKMAERNSLRLINLINDLLDIEKLEAGKLEMVFEAAPFANVIDRSVESVRAFGDQYGVNIETAKTEAIVAADSDRLVQVLVNLLSNAIKYSPRDSSVVVDLQQRDDFLRVSVIDSGRGIPAEFQDKVFERFQQVESADSKKRGGTGLGLAICKAIVEQHHGRIAVESEEGKGSTFWFEIPMAGSPAANRLLNLVADNNRSADSSRVVSDVTVPEQAEKEATGAPITFAVTTKEKVAEERK